jgi:hypothetical protein
MHLWQTVNFKSLQLLNNLDNYEELPPTAPLKIISETLIRGSKESTNIAGRKSEPR